MTRARRGEGAGQATMGAGRCKVCGTTFQYRINENQPAPPICGQLGCRARHGWGPDEWAGQARMALAREQAGIELDELDREAISRQGVRAA